MILKFWKYFSNFFFWFMGYFGNFLGLRVFWSFFWFWGYFGHFRGFGRYFANFRDFGGILVILVVFKHIW